MKTLILILCTNIIFCQSSIVASGSSNVTIGETFPIMQTIIKEKEVSLSVPKFEVPIIAPEPKPIPKKKISFIEKLIQFLKNIFK